MVRTCSCSGGSASSIEPIRKRVVTASCKTCGGKPVVDWGGSLSSSMLSTGGLELTSVINPDLTWRTVSKGNRSASRRARRPISRNYKKSGTLIDKVPEKVEDMPVSESEKLGVTILGHRFTDKVEHIPIKKRRFLFRSPSSPPQTPSPHPEEPHQFTKNQHASGQGSCLNTIVGQKLVAMDSTVPLGQVVDMGIAVDRKNSEEMNENLGHNEDFSGISILAAAACNNSMDAEDGSALELSSTQGRSSDVLVNNELCTVVEEPHKDHNIHCAEISNEGTDSYISTMHVEETTACLVPATTFPEDMACKTNAEAPSSTVNPLAAKQMQLPSERNEASSRSYESLRDDRSHWDLNTVMDAWDSPRLDPIVGPQEDVIGDISDSVCNKKAGKLQACKLQREPAATKLDNASPVQPVRGNVVGDGHEGIYLHADSRSLAVGREKSVREDQAVVAHAGEGKCQTTTCFQGKTSLSETNNALKNSLIGLDDGSKSSPNQEWTTNISSHQFDDKDTGINHSALPVAGTPVSEGNGDAASAVATDKETEDDCPADEERAENIFSSPPSLSAIATDKVTGDDCPADEERAENIFSSSPSLSAVATEKVTGDDCPAGEERAEKFFSSPPSLSAIATDKETGDECPADAKGAENICSTPQSRKHCITLSYAAIPGDAVCGIGKVLTEEGEDAGRTSGLLDNVNFPNKPQGTDHMACNPLQSGPSDCVMDHVVSNSDESHCSSSTNCEELPGSHASAGRDEHAVGVDLVVQDGQDFIANVTVDSLGQIESEKLKHKPTKPTSGTVLTPGDLSSHEAYRSSENVAPEDHHFDDVDYGSDASHDDPRVIEQESELQVGYDSQYEDGEFREPVLHGWEGDAYEEGETEHVDYRADNKEAAADYPGSISVQVDELAECQGGRYLETNDDCKTDQLMEKNMQENCVLEAGLGTVNRHSRGQFGMQDDQTDSKVDNELRGDADKANGDGELCARRYAGKDTTQSATSSMKFTGWNRLPECSRSSVDTKTEARDGNFRMIHSIAHIDGLDSGDSVARMATTPGRELLSHIEGPISSDILLRNDRSNNLDDSNRKAEREPASAQSIGRGGSSSLHMHGRGRGGDHWVDSSRWGPDCHRLPGFGHPAAKNAAAAAAAKIESSGFVVAPDGTVVKAGGFGRRRQSVNASSEGVRRSLVQRGSPLDRDEALDIHMELDPVDDMSPDRSLTLERGRSGRFGPQVVGSGLRERYRGSAPDDSSLHMQHPLVTRERSYSPGQRRGAPHLSRSCTKSPSRSRTRSPHVWPSPGGRNGCGIGSGPGLRHHSRSPPNFRSVARMERVRSPHQRPGFSADSVTGFAPTSRIRGSLQHSSRWVDNRKDHADHFREHGYKQRPSVSERRSPGRIFPRGHRFNLVGSTRRSNPDEYYRPIHPGRFPEMVGAGRGSRYDESDDDRRKHGHRYGFVHPVRRYDTDGTVKRFRYDVEDFAAHDSHNKEATEFHGRGRDGPIKRFRYDVEDFTAHDSHNKEATEFHGRGCPKAYDRGTDSRLGEPPRRSREEKGHFRYGRDWQYDSNSKSFGM